MMETVGRVFYVAKTVKLACPLLKSSPLPCPRPARVSLARVARPDPTRPLAAYEARLKLSLSSFRRLGFRGVGGLAAQPRSDGASYQQDGEEGHDAAGDEGHEGSQGSEDGRRGEEEMEKGAQLCDLPQT